MEKRVGKQIKRRIEMRKFMTAISIMFMVMLVESSSASPIIRVDPPSSYTAVVEDETSGGSANSIESELGGTGSFMIELLGGSSGAGFRFAQWEYLFH